VTWFTARRLAPLKREVAPQLALLTSLPGEESYPTFSPDGNEVAFSWNGENQDNYDIYRKLIGPGGTLLRLTEDPATDYSPAWSPDGRWIAFLREADKGLAKVVLVSALRGPERVVAEIDDGGLNPAHPPSHKLAWTADAQSLVAPDRDPETEERGLFLLSIDTGEKRRLTTGHDVGPALSPDGRALAFCRFFDFGISDLYVLRLSGDLEPQGEPRRIGGAVRATASPAWTPDGEELVFLGSRRGVRTLWRVAASGADAPQQLTVGEGADFPVIARAGKRLVYARRDYGQDIWRLELTGAEKTPQPPARFISSTRFEWFPRFSPDGARIAFQSARSGLPQIWLSNSDGTMLRQLTFFDQGLTGSPRWSPDGRRIAFDSSSEGQGEIYVVSAEGGKPRRLTNHPASDYVPSWSQDGKLIYYCSERSGGEQVWKVPADGGEPIQVTGNGGFVTQESPDRRTLHYLKTVSFETFGLWKLPVEGGKETCVIESVHARNFVVSDRGIYFIPVAEEGVYSIQFLNFETGRTHRVARLGDSIWGGFTVSPDERTFLYVRRSKPEGDLMLVENFR
jgi:Tol biopolymer transport system component